MKIRQSELSKDHVGMLCVIRFSTRSTEFVGHSQRHGLESGSVSTNYLLVGTIRSVTDDEITFENCEYSKHCHDMSWSLGPRYSSTETYKVKKINVYGWVFINQTKKSNSVMQHLLKSNKFRVWNQEHRLLERLKGKT